jgi:hypothetical protein
MQVMACTADLALRAEQPPSAPANATGATAFDPWLESMAANSTAVAGMVAQAKAEVGNQTAAWAWGSTMAVDPAMEDWAKMVRALATPFPSSRR